MANYANAVKFLTDNIKPFDIIKDIFKDMDISDMISFFTSEKLLHFYILGHIRGYIPNSKPFQILGGCNIDIISENFSGIVGIELKLNPDRNELHRFIGQIWDYSYKVPFIVGLVVFTKRSILFQNLIESKPQNAEIIIKYYTGLENNIFQTKLNP